MLDIRNDPDALIRHQYEYPDSHYLDLDGMQVHYRDTGGDRPVLLLLHGMYDSVHGWEAWCEQLHKDFRLIAVDLPNYGLTGPHPRGMFDHIYSDFLNAFTQALKVSSCHVAGNSLGGWAAWEFAQRYPDKVQRLVLIDSAGFFIWPPLLLMLLGLPFAVPVTARMKAPRFVIRHTLQQVVHNHELITDDLINRYTDIVRLEGNLAANTRVVHFLRNRMGFDTSGLKDIRQPTLVMWGEEDHWMPVSHVRRFCNAIPNSRSIIYPECGHMPMLERPKQSAMDVRAFLTGKA